MHEVGLRRVCDPLRSSAARNVRGVRVRAHGEVLGYYIDTLKKHSPTPKREKIGLARHARTPWLMRAALTRHICYLKIERQGKRVLLVALRLRMIRETESIMESKFMTCGQGSAERGKKVGEGLREA